MPAGVRLHHPTFVSCNFVVELQTLYDDPNGYDCPTCKLNHRNKAIHLRLDSNGDVIVAEGVYEKLLTVGLAGMEAVNQIAKPPPMNVGAVDIPTQEIKLGDRRFYVPGRTKYESSAITEKPLRELIDPLVEKWDRKVTAERAKKKRSFILGRRKDNG